MCPAAIMSSTFVIKRCCEFVNPWFSQYYRPGVNKFTNSVHHQTYETIGSFCLFPFWSHLVMSCF